MGKKYIFSILIMALISFSFLISCGNDFEQPNKLLSGRIGGEEWVYNGARVTYSTFNEELVVSMFSRDQPENDLCAVVISSLNYLQFSVPLATGYYVIPSDVQVSFEQEGSGSENFAATSGFVEIIEIQGLRVSGIMQARFDEDNQVEGNFIMDRCN